MPDLKLLKEQMERAKRLAKGLTSTADRDTFLALADDYQLQIDAATAPSEMQQAMPKDQEADETGASDENGTKSTGEEPEMG